MNSVDTLTSTDIGLTTVKAEFNTFNLILAIYTVIMFMIGVTIAFFYNSHNEFMYIFMILSTIMSIAGFILLLLSSKKSDCNMWIDPDILIAKILSGINMVFGILILIMGGWMFTKEPMPLGGMKTISILVIMYILIAILINSFTLCHITDDKISTTYWLNVSISCMLLIMTFYSFKNFFNVNIEISKAITSY